MAEQNSHKMQEQATAAAFNKQSVLFDERFASNSIIKYKRDRVRSHILRFLGPESQILELNAGTGEDAIYFAGQGHHVHATDISQGMQAVLEQKVSRSGLSSMVSQELCSYTELDQLSSRGPYDLLFSNFAGLNCTAELGKVLGSMDVLIKPGGFVCLVIMPGVCLWESLLMFKGKFKTAFRRFFSKDGVRAHIEGDYFTCWYYNPSFVIRQLRDSFDLVGLEGLCSIVPPSYLEHFAENYPLCYRLMTRMEDQLKDKWPWRSIGDYFIISLKKKCGLS